MDTRLLKFFIAVYEQKNLTRAAEQCFVSQPNISSGLKQLEEEIGQRLFDRHKRGVLITKDAHRLYPIAKRILGEISNIPSLFTQKQFQETVRVGIAESLPQHQKQQLLRISNSLIGNMQWDVREVNRDNELNLLVREWKFDEDLFIPLWREKYVLCIPEGHRLLDNTTIYLEDLKGENFIHCPPCEAHQQCLSILNGEGEHTTTVAYSATKSETLTLLMAGIGLTFLPEEFAKGWPGFEIRPYEGPEYYRDVGLSYQRTSLKNSAVERIVSYFSSGRVKFTNYHYPKHIS